MTNNNNNNLFNLSSFTLSKANYQLTTWLSRYGLFPPLPFLTYNYMSFIVLNLRMTESCCQRMCRVMDEHSSCRSFADYAGHLILAQKV
jgi:hypothetical protein